MFDYKNTNLPISFLNVWPTNFELRNDVNPIQLRNDNELHIPFSRLDSCKRFPMYDFPRTWNNFDDEIKALNSRSQFKKATKKFFLDKLSDTVVCNRLLCPSCHLHTNAI
jgi:hypothetical protein